MLGIEDEEADGALVAFAVAVSAGEVMKLNALCAGADGVSEEASFAGSGSSVFKTRAASPPEESCSGGDGFKKLNPDIPNAGDGEDSTWDGSDAAGVLDAGVCMKSKALTAADPVVVDVVVSGSLAPSAGAAFKNAKEDIAAGASSAGVSSPLLGATFIKEKADGAAAVDVPIASFPLSSSLALAPLISNPPNIPTFLNLSRMRKDLSALARNVVFVGYKAARLGPEAIRKPTKARHKQESAVVRRPEWRLLG